MKILLLALLLTAPLLRGRVTQLVWNNQPQAAHFGVWDVSGPLRAAVATSITPSVVVDLPPGSRAAVSAYAWSPDGVLTESDMCPAVTIPILALLSIQMSGDLRAWSTLDTYRMEVGDPTIDPRNDGPWLVDSRGDIFLIEPRPSQTRFYRLKLEIP